MRVFTRHTTISSLSAALLFLLTQCASDNVAGGSSEVGNPVVSGLIVDTGGEAAPKTIVYLLHQNSAPATGAAAIDTTDSNGRYTLTAPDTGIFNLQALRVSDNSCLIRLGLHIDTTESAAHVDTLRQGGSVAIAVVPGLYSENSSYFIPGTLLSATIDTTAGFIVLPNVPAGTLPPLHYTTNTQGEVPLPLSDSLHIVSDSVNTIALPGWTDSLRIVLNTSATGAGIHEGVGDFPILIRLSSATFDFSTARGDGGDLRFTDATGALLPHEIEYFDSLAHEAAIWVRIDTIYADNANQSITLRWGNPLATRDTRFPAVFDTASGYQAVWHMGAATQLTDATENHYNATPHILDTQKPAAGVIGKAQYFNGTSDYAEVTQSAGSSLNFPENGIYTLYAWVCSDTITAGTGQVFLSKSEWQYSLEIDRENSFWHMSEYSGTNGLQRIGVPATAHQWTLVVGVRDNAAMRLYINGVMVSDSIFGGTGTVARDESKNLTIGKIANATDRFMNGTLDELRILNRAVGNAWIRLCFENQKSDNSLVSIVPFD